MNAAANPHPAIVREHWYEHGCLVSRAYPRRRQSYERRCSDANYHEIVRAFETAGRPLSARDITLTTGVPLIGVMTVLPLLVDRNHLVRRPDRTYAPVRPHRFTRDALELLAGIRDSQPAMPDRRR